MCIAEGAFADLRCSRSNPLEDVTILNKPREFAKGIIKDGRVVTSRAMVSRCRSRWFDTSLVRYLLWIPFWFGSSLARYEIGLIPQEVDPSV